MSNNTLMAITAVGFFGIVIAIFGLSAWLFIADRTWPAIAFFTVGGLALGAINIKHNMRDEPAPSSKQG